MKTMKIRCEIIIECKNKKEAVAINSALSLDNETYMKSDAIGSRIHAKIEADDILSLSSTVNDFLSCLNVSKSSCSVINDTR